MWDDSDPNISRWKKLKTAQDIQNILDSLNKDYLESKEQLKIFQKKHDARYGNTDFSMEIDTYQTITTVIEGHLVSHNEELIALQEIA